METTMTASNPDASSERALKRLEPFIGTWIEEVTMPGVPAGRMTFDWIPDGWFVVMRSEIEDPAFPTASASSPSTPQGMALPALLRLARRCARLLDDCLGRRLDAAA